MDLVEGLEQERKRVEELLEIYEAIPAGKFAALMMRASLAKAKEAAEKMDAVAMLRACVDLQGYKE